MLKGWIEGKSIAPYIDGQLVIPRLGIDALVSFLVDTGADESLIIPSDGIAIGIDYTELKPSLIYLGIGGSIVRFTLNLRSLPFPIRCLPSPMI